MSKKEQVNIPEPESVETPIVEEEIKSQINEFVNAVYSSSESPISFDDIYEVQKWILYANNKIGIDS